MRSDNVGPTLLQNVTQLPDVPIREDFVCQHIEAYSKDIDGNITLRKILFLNANFSLSSSSCLLSKGPRKKVIRRCALRLPEDRNCDLVYWRFKLYGKYSFTNVTCTECETDGCNSSAFNYIWIPLLFASIILSLLIK